MSGVHPVRQTSVRVPLEAYAVLDRIVAEDETKRDAAIRDLLTNYVDSQQALNADDRVTHLTTALRLPRLPPGRNREDPRPQLRFRISDSLKAAALSHAFTLPGQSRHGHHDYAARPLTDAVLTAIFLRKPFDVPGCERMPGTLTHRTATGLWRLTVAATLTAAERRAIWGSETDDIVPVLTEEDVAWHHPWRFEVAEHLLRQICEQDDAADVAEVMAMLYDQTTAFRNLLADVRRHHFSTVWLTDGMPSPRSDPAGRGGAAVWRAHRKLALEALGEWATGPAPRGRFIITPPDWKLCLPAGWRIRSFAHGEHVPAELVDHAVAGDVAVLTCRSRTGFWPLDGKGDPVPGFEAVVRGGKDLSSERLLETVMHRLDYPHVGVPADTACDLSFITEVDRDDLIASVRTINESRMRETLKVAVQRLSRDEILKMVDAQNDVRRFSRLAAKHHLRFDRRRPYWSWDVRSIPEALEDEHSPERIAWLTAAMARITDHVLESDMQDAANKAFHLGRTRPEDTDL